jgi:hypothetical protein
VNRQRLFFVLLFAALLAARLCHSGVQWAEESLPLAAAAQMQHGQALYRDIWFDKPPLLPSVCLLWGARTGWPLRTAGALYDLLACFLAYRFARDLWGQREARWAAALLGFFLICGIPSAVTPLAADLLMLAPHLAAVWLAARGRTFLSGAAAGVAFLVNPKALIVAAVCALWNPAGIPLLAAGFLSVSAAGAAALAASGSLVPYYEQVWAWGRTYAGRTFVADPATNALARTLNWMGFHCAIVIAAVYGLRADKAWGSRAKWVAWLSLSALATAAGMRFFPRYFFQLLPVVVLLAARGFAAMPRTHARVVALLLLIPLVRFAPRYALLAAGRSSGWADTAMDRDSRAASARLAALAHTGDTLFVWGFRPEIYTYAKLPAASRYLDSQPLTGVPADRHLTQSVAVDPAAARLHRAQLVRTRPAFIADGLGPYNPALAITAYPDLHAWLAAYREVERTHETVIYRRVAP